MSVKAVNTAFESIYYKCRSEEREFKPAKKVKLSFHQSSLFLLLSAGERQARCDVQPAMQQPAHVTAGLAI